MDGCNFYPLHTSLTSVISDPLVFHPPPIGLRKTFPGMAVTPEAGRDSVVLPVVKVTAILWPTDRNAV